MCVLQYTDELTPLMEWLEDNVSKSTREINSSSASETEEHQERQEKVKSRYHISVTHAIMQECQGGCKVRNNIFVLIGDSSVAKDYYSGKK